METETMRAYACPSCGARLESDGAGFRCEEHGLWLRYSENLLVHAPADEYKLRDRFTMPWESAARPI
jgi:tRNA(Ile2) C34 agmatinyltransferase TiaS